jgi:hypothetical protein
MKLSMVLQVIINLSLCFILCFSNSVLSGIIDFETTATGAVPIDNQVIGLNDDFSADGVLVSFGFDTTGNGVTDSEAVFEAIAGGEESGNSGFQSLYTGKYDIPEPNSANLLGGFFLRQQNAYQPFGTFHINYTADNPVTEASGEVWDIDGKPSKTEQFFVEAYNDDILLDSMASPLGDDKDLDGMPWAFGFENLTNITRIEITFTGSKTKGIGLAFNNFSPVEDISVQTNSISEPSTMGIFSMVIIGFMLRRSKL